MVCEPVVCTTCCAVPCCVGCGPLPPSDISEHLLNHQVPPGPSLWNFHDEDSFEVSQPMSWMFQVEGVAVGFMSLCSRVNLQLLHECFDLGPFHGLCTPHPNDVLEPSPELSAQGIPGKVACTGARGECRRMCHALGWVMGLGGTCHSSVSSPLSGVVPVDPGLLVHLSVSTGSQEQGVDR